MKGPLAQVMQQAQEMKRKWDSAREELESMEVTGEAGGGMVKVTMTGRNDVRNVHIDPIALDDRGMLEDLIAAAMNDAVRRVEAAREEKMAGLTEGLQLPGGMSFPGGLDRLF